jgi:hypothetical protein
MHPDDHTIEVLLFYCNRSNFNLRSASFRPAESVGDFDDFINVDLTRLLEQNSRACKIVFMLAQTNRHQRYGKSQIPPQEKKL